MPTIGKITMLVISPENSKTVLKVSYGDGTIKRIPFNNS